MYFDFCVGGKPANDAKLALDTIFHILGDGSYRTPRKEITSGKTYFVCTVKGAGVINFDGTTHTLTQGKCMFMKPRFDFNYHCAQDVWHFWWFEFRNETTMLSTNEIFKTPVNDFKIDLFEQSLLYAKEERWDIAEALFEAACGIMHHNLLTQSASAGDELLHAAEQYIRDNIASVSVAELCTSLQIKERTLRNLFGRALAQSPKQVIVKTRMGVAQQMLENTVLPISAIASQLGFSSQFHFSRAFKEFIGTPPQQYRRALLRK